MKIDPPNNDQDIIKQIAANIAAAVEKAKLQKTTAALDTVIAAIDIMGLPLEVARKVEELIKKARDDLAQQEDTEKAIIRNRIEDQKQEAKEQGERAKTAEEKRIDTIYSKFDSFHEGYLKKQKEENKNLDEALEAIRSGKDINEELKRKLLKTPEEIEEEKAKWKHIELTRQTAQAEHEHCEKEIHKINKELDKVLGHEHEKRGTLHQHKNDLARRQEVAQAKIDETEKHYNERKHRAKNIQEGIEHSHKHGNQGNINYVKEAAQLFKDIQGISHEEVVQGTKQEKAQKQIQKKPLSEVEKQKRHLQEAKTFVLENFSVDQPIEVREFCANVIAHHITPVMLSQMKLELAQGKNLNLPQVSFEQVQEIKSPTPVPHGKQVLEQGKKAGIWEH